MRCLRLPALLLLGILVACAKPVAPEKLGTIRSIGVVSTLGETFTVQHFGATAFGNQSARTPVDWGLDAAIAETVAAALAPRFAARPLAVPRGALADTAPDETELVPSGRRPLAAALRAALPEPGVDAVLVLRPYARQIGNTVHRVEGLGIVTTGGGIMRRTRDLHALYAATLVDARDNALLAHANAGGVSWDKMIPGPHMALDPAPDAATLAGFTEAQRAALAAQVRQVIAASLPQTFRELGLAP